MSIQAHVSGRLGMALIVSCDGRRLVDRHGRVSVPTGAQIAELLSENSELKTFVLSSEESAADCLRDEIHFQDCLFLFLCICDHALSLSTRLICAQELEQALEDEPLKDRLVVRLLSCPMPVEVRSHRREMLNTFTSFKQLTLCLRRAFSAQESCDEISAAWMVACSSLGTQEQSELRAEFIEDGTFASLVDALSTRDLHAFNEEFVLQSLRGRYSSLNANARIVLGEIQGGLRHLLVKGTSQTTLPIRIRRRTPARIGSAADDDFLGGKGQPESGSRLTAFEAKTQVDKQIAAINNEFYSGRDDLAEKYIDDLIRFQLTNSERDHIAKSLCNLAASALDANRLAMADWLSERATRIEVVDSVVLTTRAEVLKNLGMFQASLSRFDEAKLLFPDSAYAWNGIGDVLKEMGNYDEALTAYMESERRFPDDSVAFNGRVSVLRAQGKRKEAIAYALQVVELFPYDAVSRATLASALRDDGKYRPSVYQYRKALSLDSHNFRTILGYVNTLSLTKDGIQVGLNFLDDRLKVLPNSAPLINQKAILLRKAGKYEEALAVAEKLVNEQPKYTIGRFGHASILVAKGDFEAVSGALPPIDELRSETDWFGPRILALAFIAQGNFEEAERILRHALEMCPWRRVKVGLRSTLGYVQMQLGKMQESIHNLEHDISLIDYRSRELRWTLLGGAHLMLGHKGLGIRLIQNAASTSDPNLIVFARSILTASTDSFRRLRTIPDQATREVLLAA